MQSYWLHSSILLDRAGEWSYRAKKRGIEKAC
jgi:hypothetical protein